MDNKISLVYENGQYTLYIDEKVISVNKYIDNAIDNFTQTINNNAILKSIPWETIEKDLEGIKDDRLEINKEFKTLTFEDMKYFYSTDKVFNMHKGAMKQLVGGYNLFSFVVKMVDAGYIKNYLEILNFCEEVLSYKVTYRTTESSISVLSPAFNYGSAEYNFVSGKVNKGATIENMTFNEYKKYVIDKIK
ncbi:hypothetical protein [Clostridium sp. Ade.TY]|uniref:hypothetical protein n=1 Tax=Clostridium sp. Ade.TY TaxID=1391647 RepID=UPI00041B0481|nr:hypothetical protein [Clostridium sp. Ade.TY]